MRIIISKNPDDLKAANPDATVEAEYGKILVEGSVITLAHHMDRSDNPPPSLRENEIVPGVQTIGISHMDLDTLGGVLSLMGKKPEAPSFWDLVAFVDVNGPHKIPEFDPPKEDVDRLLAFHAARPDIDCPKEGAHDITDQVVEMTGLLNRILSGDPDLLKQGRKMRMAEEDLNRRSFMSRRDEVGGVILRKKPVGPDGKKPFVNHLYFTPEGEPARVVITHEDNPSDGGAITVSLYDPIPGIHVGELLSEYFGPECGGHAGIGGTERNLPRPFQDALSFGLHLIEKIKEAEASVAV